MKNGFVPVQLDDYVNLHLRSNPDIERSDLIERLQYAIKAFKMDERCACGSPIWIIGSAEAGLACFTCITGDAAPDQDYEIDVGEPTSSA